MIEALLKAGTSPNRHMVRRNAADDIGSDQEHRGGETCSPMEQMSTRLRNSAARLQHVAAAENHPDAVKVLIDHGAPWIRVLRKEDFGSVKMAGGGAFMDRPEGGLTPLFLAAREGAIETAQVLIAAGAEVNITETQYGYTPIMAAIFNGHYDFAGMLLEKGADVNDGCLYLTTEMRNLAFYKNRPNPPEKDKKLSNLDVIRILLDRGADANKAYTKKIPPREAQGDIKVVAGATPLFRATKSMDLAAIRLLIEKGANPSVTTTDHSTPLMVAAGLGAPLATDEDTIQGATKGDPLDAMKLFLKAGADVNAANDLGFTAVHYAAQGGRNRIVEFLAGNGAKLDVKNKAGKTPLDIAMAPGPQGRYMEVDGSSQTSTAALLRKLMAQ